MFGDMYTFAFRAWWTYYLLKGLDMYTEEERRSLTGYVPSTKGIENTRHKMFMSAKFFPETDETNSTPPYTGEHIEEDGA